jgi:hypothetical protein
MNAFIFSVGVTAGGMQGRLDNLMNIDAFIFI